MMGGAELLLVLLFGPILVIPAWRICARAGFPGVLGLLALVPVANLVLLYWVAFARWPASDG